MLTRILNIDTDPIIKHPVGTKHVQIRNPLFLHHTILLDRQRLGIPRNPRFATRCRVEVVDLFASEVRHFGASIGRFSGSRDERV